MAPEDNPADEVQITKEEWEAQRSAWEHCPTCRGSGHLPYAHQNKLCLAHGAQFAFADTGCTCEPCPTCAAHFKAVEEAVKEALETECAKCKASEVRAIRVDLAVPHN